MLPQELDWITWPEEEEKCISEIYIKVMKNEIQINRQT